MQLLFTSKLLAVNPHIASRIWTPNLFLHHNHSLLSCPSKASPLFISIWLNIVTHLTTHSHKLFPTSIYIACAIKFSNLCCTMFWEWEGKTLKLIKCGCWWDAVSCEELKCQEKTPVKRETIFVFYSPVMLTFYSSPPTAWRPNGVTQS